MENNSTHKEHSIALIDTAIDPEKSRTLERGLTIKKIIADAVPISTLIRDVGGRKVAIALDVQLTRLMYSMNLKWNLTDGQIADAVEDLLEKFPHESLEDFILCFKKIRLGEYGELMRLDAAIIFTCMKKYLEEKYTAVEEATHTNHPLGGNDIDKLMADALEAGGEEMKKIRPLTEEEVEREGQEKPVKQVYKFDEVEARRSIDAHMDKIRKFQEMTIRERHPAWTDEQVANRMAELRDKKIN